MPDTFTACLKSGVAVSQYTSLQLFTSGRSERGIVKRLSSSSSHSNVLILKSIVRDALVTSVMWHLPLVSFHTSHESMVPKHRSPRSARSRMPFTLSRIHLIFVAEK